MTRVRGEAGKSAKGGARASELQEQDRVQMQEPEQEH